MNGYVMYFKVAAFAKERRLNSIVLGPVKTHQTPTQSMAKGFKLAEISSGLILTVMILQ